MKPVHVLIAVCLVLAAVFVLSLAAKGTTGAFVASDNFVLAVVVVILALTALLYRANFK